MAPIRRRHPVAVLVAVPATALTALALAACGDDDGGSADRTETDAEVDVTDPSTGKPGPPRQLPDRYKPGPGGGTDPGDQPAVTVPPSAQPHVDAAMADLADRVGADVATISVVDYRDVTWGDASLGCPQPDTMYIQRLTPGTLLVLRAANGATFEYHGGPDGALSYCAEPQPPVQGPGTG